ncbi:MAG: hypothetical protein CMB17_02340 [Euryarchaeota archaeon]|nr:hypothetical protein [Euryarchaeota archaeon]
MMNNDQLYYDSLMSQGHPPEHALHYTRMYYPNFYPVTYQQNLTSNMNYYVPVVQQKKKDHTTLIVVGVVVFALIVVVMLIIAVTAVVILDSSDNTPEFGFRHDVSQELFEDLGDNIAPYDSTDYPDFSSVVYIEGETSDGEVYSGSGVLIGERWVLTAAHVVEGLEVSKTNVWFGNDYQSAVAQSPISDYYIHPGWPYAEKYSASEVDEILEEGTDIALIELVESVSISEDISIAEWNNDTDLIDGDQLLGSSIYISGFGDYNEGNSMCSDYCLTDNDGLYSKRRAWENTLDRVVLDIDSSINFDGHDKWKGGWVVYDFDSPSSDKNGLANGESYSFAQGDYSYGGKGDSNSEPTTLEGTSVAGDSGGPTFVLIQGKWQVIGLTSHGSEAANYGDVAFNTAVAIHTDWICSHDSSEEIPGC